ncbi:hypothetical protein B0T17DRAFT_255182 [Bombardia bombarda]|uniref:Uncharacterized protein n=1 Tax=Bombardia bombarda TaxID=252184 RepID=A0AA39X097_9PEZI|nr:hypothetical protein B0T17DRAFT_255182 [Bombardia bombarda]
MVIRTSRLKETMTMSHSENRPTALLGFASVTPPVMATPRNLRIGWAQTVSFTLILSLFAADLVSGTCYKLDGAPYSRIRPDDGDWVPCDNTARVSSCCSSKDYCMGNGMCLDAGANNYFSLQGCTDPSWPAPCVTNPKCESNIRMFDPSSLSLITVITTNTTPFTKKKKATATPSSSPAPKPPTPPSTTAAARPPTAAPTKQTSSPSRASPRSPAQPSSPPTTPTPTAAAPPPPPPSP